ncbi:metallophosphoesterase family protein [Pseudalkalibacillus hwajinpoensis]|uniref:metallophosphoesterase family protein n=1 Tax=Guptibacillus hwajinpoensis TaxID=208199 RepID=UPI00325AF48A
MNVIIISDTHMPRMAKQFPEVLEVELRKADLIIHAGDWKTKQVYEELTQFAPVTGVYGNVDESFFYENFQNKIILDLKSHRIGVTHGHGKGKTTEKRAVDHFQDDEVELILFGHSHIPLHKGYEGKIIFNPGSPTDKRKQSHYSFGKLTLQEGQPIHINHIFFEKK